VAVEYGSEKITYRELDWRANQLAHYLRKQGVGPEMLVGLWVERSLEMVIGILGILKAGGACMPLDGSYPEERLEYMIEDAQVSLMLVGKKQEKKMPRVWVPVVVMDGEDREWESEAEGRLRSGVSGKNLAYVIFTSGSTGKPKGVGVEHRQLANYIQAIDEKLQIQVGMRLALVSTYAADLGYTMIFPALCHGGCLNVVDADWVLDAGKLTQHFSHHPIDYLKIVPSHLQALLGSNPGSGLLPRRWLVVGGEASSWDLIRQVKMRGAGCRVLNHYGPTETTVGVLTYDTTQESEGAKALGMVPVGRPLSNGKVYVLDKEMNPAGIGMRGEIYIGGAGLARGYVNRAEMTAERFLPNPFSRTGGERLYRTGDVARYREDGNIEYLGRKDEQVKIRGYRIELGEIEARLKEHGLVKEAVAVTRESGEENGEKRLVAYVVMANATAEERGIGDSTTEGREPDAGELSAMLRTYLAGWLPEYMIPAAIVRLERIPLTPNGKLDRKALPGPEGEAFAQRSYEPPQGEMEEVLANLWQELLGIERVGRHDNFFELGGHSLLAVRMLSHLLNNLNVQIELSTLFNYPQLSLFAKKVLIASIEQEFDSIEFQNFVSAEDSKS
jgi:amino acid adenylation domain-containing protein